VFVDSVTCDLPCVVPALGRPLHIVGENLDRTVDAPLPGSRVIIRPPGRGHRSAGLALTITGGVLALGGVALFTHSGFRDDVGQWDPVVEEFTGIGFMVIGTGSLIAGIVLLAQGSTNSVEVLRPGRPPEARTSWRLNTLGISPAQGGAVARIGWSF
jgi:hypothetical protein